MRGTLSLESRMHSPSLESPELIAVIDCGGLEKLLVMLASSRTGAAVHLHRARVNAAGVVTSTSLHVVFGEHQLAPLRQALDRIERILGHAVPIGEEPAHLALETEQSA
jgi:hypothetical protein